MSKTTATRMPKVTVQKLGLNDTTNDGAFYPKVDGSPVGENGRAFWPSRTEARAVGNRFAAKLANSTT